MATVGRIEKNYFGVTLYITTRTGREYACRVNFWTPTTGGGADCNIQTWPGYGSYRGVVHLNRQQKAALQKAYKLEV